MVEGEMRDVKTTAFMQGFSQENRTQESLYYPEMNDIYGLVQYFCRDASYSIVYGNYIQHSYRDFLKAHKRTEKEQAHEKAEGY